jgi:hypothetical protein
MIDTMVTILRLATGEDIVGLVSETKTDYQIITPFKVIFRRLHKKAVGLTIVPWLPDELLEEHTIAVAKSQVVCALTPKKEFVDYYHRISDEFYMTLIDLDSAYRTQLMQLDKQLPATTAWPNVEEMLAQSYRNHHPLIDPFDELEDDEEDDEDDEPPTFH